LLFGGGERFTGVGFLHFPFLAEGAEEAEEAEGEEIRNFLLIIDHW
jgi:hypothetical protein